MDQKGKNKVKMIDLAHVLNDFLYLSTIIDIYDTKKVLH